MPDKPMPTPGEWIVERYGDGDSLVIHSDQDNRVCFMATPGSQGDLEKIEQDAALIAAAGTAAHEVKQMGFDPVEAARFTPRSYTVLRLLRDNLNAVIRNMGEGAGRDVLIDSVMEADMLLSHVTDPVEEASHTRAAGKEGSGHE